MILRFREASSNPRYIAFNSALKTYTTNPKEVKKGFVMQISCNGYDHIAEEISFNGYDHADNLNKPVGKEDCPTW